MKENVMLIYVIITVDTVNIKEQLIGISWY